MKGESYGGHSQSITHLMRSIPQSKSIRCLTLTCLIGLTIGYFIQVWTPLRIASDSYRYLSMAASAAHGKGYLVNGAVDQFPKGYPWVLKSLIESGMARSASVVLINIIALSVSLGLLSMMLITTGIGVDITVVTVILSLSSWVVISHITLVLSDVLYTGLSFCSLACLYIYWHKSRVRKWHWFLGSICFAIVAIEVRSAGLVFIPVLICVAFFHSDSKYFRDFLREHILVLSTFIFLILIVVPFGIFVLSTTSWFSSQFIRNQSYFQYLLRALKAHGIFAFISTNLSYRIFELGQILINMPVNIAWSRIHPTLMIASGCGAIGWIVLLYGLWLLRHTFTPIIIYAYFYIALIICWPYYSCRFLLPLIPIFSVALVEVAQHFSYNNIIINKIFKGYLIYFVILGLIAIVHSTLISLAGRNFSEVYGNGGLRMTYRYVLKNNKPIDMKEVNLREAHLLELFGMTQ